MNKSISALLKPTLLENAWLYLPASFKNDELPNLTTVLAISHTIGREYSFIVKIDKIEYTNIDYPKLYVDKEIVNALLEDDKVDLIPFKVPDAETITLLVSENSSVFEGSWETNISNQFTGQILDVGGELLITWPSSNPFIVETILLHSQPQAPVRLNDNTKVFVKKLDEMAIQEKVVEANNKKIIRIAQYEKQMQTSILEIIGNIKNGNLDSERTEFKFTATPLTIYAGIKNLLKSWDCTHDNKNIIADDFTAGLDFVLFESKYKPKAMVEFFVSSKKDDGKVIMNVYAITEKYLEEINTDLKTDIRSLSITVRNTNRVIDNTCPSCGTRFEFVEIDDKGWIECENCYVIIEVPAKYRYQ